MAIRAIARAIPYGHTRHCVWPYVSLRMAIRAIAYGHTRHCVWPYVPLRMAIRAIAYGTIYEVSTCAFCVYMYCPYDVRFIKESKVQLGLRLIHVHRKNNLGISVISSNVPGVRVDGRRHRTP